MTRSAASLFLLLLASISPAYAIGRCAGRSLQSISVQSGSRFDLPVVVIPGANHYYLQRTFRADALTNDDPFMVLGNADAEILTAFQPFRIGDTLYNTWPGADNWSVYYAVTAMNRFDPAFVPCVQDVLVSVAPDPLLQKDGARIVIPVLGSLRGASNSTFRTSLTLTNRYSASPDEQSPLTGRIVFHRSGVPASSSDPSLDYAVLPGRTAVFDDIMAALHVEGIGSLDILPDAGSSNFYPAPTVRAQLISLGAAGGTLGTDIPVVTMTGPAYGAVWSGTLQPRIQVVDPANKRYNVGVCTLSDGVKLTARLVSADGTEKASVTRSYPADYHIQGSLRDWFGDLVAPGDAILLDATHESRPSLPGGAIVYLAETDNTTNDVTLIVPQRDPTDTTPPIVACRSFCSFLTF